MAARTHSSDRPWYAEGLRFRCTACGECCTGAPGHVWVEKDDIERMAKALGLSRKAYERKYVRRVGRRKSLKERENGDCVMLGEGDRRCRAYAAKPARCSTFPFWPEVLDSPESWRETGERCEGIGLGDAYPLADIERLAAGDAGPLLERQAEAEATGDAVREVSPVGAAGAAREPDEATWAAALGALEEVYADLAREMPRFRFTCAASGACCDFDAYGHRLYATTLEAEHFFRNAPARQNENERHCPAWGKDRLCHAREGRMLGCRTYFCGPYPNETPEDVHERYFPRIRALHDRFAIPYAYRDITDWARDRRPDGT